MQLYDLAGRDPEHRFSPYCWRSRLALAHKGVEAEIIPWRFTDKPAIVFSGQGKVPILVDDKNIIIDSTRIADYLEAKYPDRPSLFGGPEARALTGFIVTWTDLVLLPALVRCYVSDIVRHLDERDRGYFRETREARFGMTLEATTSDRDTKLPALRQMLAPLRQILGQQAYLGGAEPLYADYVVFGGFQWVRMVSRFEILEEDDPVRAWRERMLDAHAGLARQAPCCT